MRYQTIIFDLDGTLTDSGEGIMNSAEYAFKQLGLAVPDRQELRKIVGPPLTYSFPLFGVPENQVEEAILFYRDQYNNRGGKHQNHVYPGIEEMLRQLKEAGCHLFVATSKPEPLAQEIMEGFALMPYFEMVAGASWDHSRETKGEVLQYLLSFTGDTGKTVMIGDTHFDVIGAHELNIPGIGVTWGYGLKEEMIKAEAETIVDSPEELVAYLLQADEQKR